MDLSNLSTELPATSDIESVSLSGLNTELTNNFKTAAKSVSSLFATSRKETKKEAAESKTAFSDAARAVASLYRTASDCNVLLMHKGYLDLLDDILQMMASGEDVENWVLTKRAELVNYYNHKEPRDIEPNVLPNALSAPAVKTTSGNVATKSYPNQDPSSLQADSTSDPTPSSSQKVDLQSYASNVNPNRNLIAASESHSTHSTRPAHFATVSQGPITVSGIITQNEFSIPNNVDFNMPLELATDIRFRPSFPPLSMTFKRRKGRKDGPRKKVGIYELTSSEESESEYADSVELKKRAWASNQEPKRRKRDSL